MENIEQKGSNQDDTFLVFGDASMIGGFKKERHELNFMIEKIDFSAKSQQEICICSNIDIMTTETQVKFDVILIKNRHHVFYEGSNSTYGKVSVIVLKNLEENKQDFGNLLLKLKKLNDLNIKGNLKLLGIALVENTAHLIFEYVSSNFVKKITDIDFNEMKKYVLLFNLIEHISKLHKINMSMVDLRKDTILLGSNDVFKYLVPFEEYKNLIKGELEDNNQFNRLSSPEHIQQRVIGLENDVWVIGCLFVEIFSKKEVWYGITEEEIKEDLKKNYVPKIHADIPKNAWGVICECLNPFTETRIQSDELLFKYSIICKRLNCIEINSETTNYIESYQKQIMNTSIINYSQIDVNLNQSVLIENQSMLNLNQSIIEEQKKINIEEVKTENLESPEVNRCHAHSKYEAFLFCAQCNDAICESCKKTTHSSHADKGVFYEFLEFINIARNRTHTYQERFEKYIEACNIPNLEIYEANYKYNDEMMEKLYLDQKIKIEEQMSYLIKKIEEIKVIEIANLTKYKEIFQQMNFKNQENFNMLVKEIQLIEEMLKEKSQNFLKFQTLSYETKVEIMKNVSKDEVTLSNKKKNIIRYISNYQKESSEVNKVKRYFETFIEKFKENKTVDLVKVIEKKVVTTSQKYESIVVDEYIKSLKHEFEQIQLISSRNYFSSSSARELYISIVNTNKIFSYNVDIDKFALTEIDFSKMPIDKFPNYSRSVIINGNLLVNGGYSEELKATLPYFFFYNKNEKSLTRFTDMLYGHSAHSLIFIPPQYIVVISGSGIRKCEKYFMESNSWAELPEISIPRQNTTLYYHNKQYLYAFGGAYWDEKDKNFAYLSTVERLDMGIGSVEGGKYWEVIKTYQISNNINIRKSVMTAISYNESKILLIGGSVSNNSYSDECILFDFEKNEFSKKEGLILPRRTCFPHKFFMYSGDKCYQLDNDGNVYSFDFNLLKFSLIKENNIKAK